MTTLLEKRDPSGGWRIFVACFMFTTFIMLGFVSWTISKAYVNGKTNLKVVCQAIDKAMDADDKRPVECEEFLSP